MLRRVGAFADRAANPILLKEMWQSVHSRLSMAFFWLLLVAALLIYYVAVGGRGEATGEGMFIAFAALMALMVAYMIPISAFTSLQRDIGSGTIELVQITSLSARQLIRGRLLAAGMRIVLLLSLIAPFAVTSFLFGGIDPVTILLTVYGMLLAAFGICAVAVFLASLTAFRRLRMLAALAFWGLVLIGTVLLLTGVLPQVAYLLRYGTGASGLSGTPGPGSMLLIIGWATVFCALWVMLLTSGAANSLTFPQDRSSARSKVLALLIVGAMFGAYLLLMLTGAGPGGAVPGVFQVQACALIGVLSLFWITADAHVPHRHQARIDQLGLGARVLYGPFRDGAGSTAIYLLLALIMAGPGSAALAPGGVPFDFNVYIAVLTGVYVLYLGALAGLATRLLRPARRNALHRRGAMLIIVIANALALYTWAGIHGWQAAAEPSALRAFLPLLYLMTLGQSTEPAAFVGHMAGPFLIGVVYHIVAGLGERARLSDSGRPMTPSPLEAGA